MVRVVKYPSGKVIEVPLQGTRIKVIRVLSFLGYHPWQVLVVKEGVPITEDESLSNDDVLEIYEVVSSG